MPAHTPSLASHNVLHKDTLKQKETLVQELQQRLSDLEEFSGTGFWEWDIAEKIFTASSGFIQIYDFPAPSAKQVSTPLSFLLAPVLSEERKYTANALISLLKEAKPFSINHHIANRDGQKKRIHHQARVEYNEEGIAVKLIGYIKDNTEEEQSLTRADNSKKKYEILYDKYKDLFENANDAIFIVNQDLNYVDVNKKAVELFGFSKKEFLSMSILDVIPKSQKPLSNKEFNALWKNKKYDRFIGKQRTKDGRWLDIEVNSSAIIEQGKIVGSRDIVRDISDRIRMEKKLRELAITDELTELLNRRGFLKMARNQLKVIQRTRDELYVIYADLDNLKTINDQCGHKTGDIILSETAKLFKRTFRETDLIARMGGDEFAILLTGKPGERDELLVKRRLEENLASFNEKHQTAFPLMFSIGFSRYDHASPCSIEELLSQADTSMFREKRNKKTGV